MGKLPAHSCLVTPQNFLDPAVGKADFNFLSQHAEFVAAQNLEALHRHGSCFSPTQISTKRLAPHIPVLSSPDPPLRSWEGNFDVRLLICSKEHLCQVKTTRKSSTKGKGTGNISVLGFRRASPSLPENLKIKKPCCCCL
ncbi:Hypothetical predicted protein [Podarcis lilfordi]|uniref:Uncharacterized protein n=1 Tax=Podarcis lilfordi TaxID=74358 RepID=A0AA35KRF3_9SAUR|nr:Hypothetical predicted protein [Podarcis lilfordi]